VDCGVAVGGGSKHLDIVDDPTNRDRLFLGDDSETLRRKWRRVRTAG
jgi:hypothetical protein